MILLAEIESIFSTVPFHRELIINTPLKGNKKRMKEKLYLDGVPEDTKEEISFLYELGVEIEELEYLIRVKFRESLNLKTF